MTEMNERTIKITAWLSPSEAEAFAQFLKRAGHSDYLRNAADSGEAYEMLYAGEEIRKALTEAGYAPR